MAIHLLTLYVQLESPLLLGGMTCPCRRRRRLIMENVLKYGFRAGSGSFWLARPMAALPLIATYFSLSIFAVVRALALARHRARAPAGVVSAFACRLETRSVIILSPIIEMIRNPQILVG